MNKQDKIFNIIKKRTSKKFDKSTEITFLGFDSLDLVELVMEIEEELEIKIPDDKLSVIKTIDDLLVLVDDL